MNQIRKLFLIILSSIFFAGCATTANVTQSPQKIVFSAKEGYAIALVGAVEYKKLPTCTVPPTTVICHDPAILAQLQKADDVTAVALDSAESAVRTPGIGDSAINFAVVAGKAALDAFTSITSRLRTK